MNRSGKLLYMMLNFFNRSARPRTLMCIYKLVPLLLSVPLGKRSCQQNTMLTAVGCLLALLSTVGATITPNVDARALCEDFATYSTRPEGTPSKGTVAPGSTYGTISSDRHRIKGPLGLPLMRPGPACRTFNSSAVEKVVANLTSRMKDPDLAR
jgi:hypothetical protein